MVDETNNEHADLKGMRTLIESVGRMSIEIKTSGCKCGRDIGCMVLYGRYINDGESWNVDDVEHLCEECGIDHAINRKFGRVIFW